MQPEFFNGLLQLGGIGSVLAWMLYRSDLRMERMERALDRLTRAQMLMLISREDVDPPIKAQARAILQEMAPRHDLED